MDGWVERSFDAPNVRFRCSCGWEGIDEDVDAWEVQKARDRVVRQCPACGDAVPEWGAIPSIEGAAIVARGPLRRAIDESDVRLDEE